MMNLAKGFKRLTLFLSLLAGPTVFFFAVFLEGPPGPEPIEAVAFLLLFWVIGFAGIWAIYALVAFVVNGFLDTKVERKRSRDTMNLRRGLRRITLLLAIVAGILGAILGGIVAVNIGCKERAGDYKKYHSKSFIVANVISGDSININVADGKHNHTRVQLWGINTPQTIMEQATKFITELALGKPVTVYLDEGNRTRDKYGRLLAYVQLADGRFLNEVLLTEGFAYADLQLDHSFYHKYKQLEAIAQGQKKRLWGIEPKPDRHKLSLDSSIAPLVIKVVLGGLVGAAVGFFGTWLVVWFGGLAIYKLIRWIVLGFYDSQDKDVRGKSNEATG